MKNTKLLIIIIVIAIVIAGAIFVIANKSKSTNQIPVATSSQIPLESPIQTPTTSPAAVQTSPSGYSEALKTKVRSEFVSSCNTKGHYSIAICNCVADYLAKNYSETELAKIYVLYHSSGQIPSEVETSLSSCTKK
jgi:hypothetical protein